MHPQHENPRSFPIKPYGASSRKCATFWLSAPDASEEEAPWKVKLSMGSVQLSNNKPIA
jgi:hypothetical protein